VFGWVVATAGSLIGGSAGVAKEEPAFVGITPAGVQWRDIPDSHGVQDTADSRARARPDQTKNTVKCYLTEIQGLRLL